jgi:flavodoxin
MKALVVYDSFFGNTEKIAQAVGSALGDAAVVKVADFKPEMLQEVELLAVGSPTRAFQASPGIKTFLKNLQKDSLKGVKVAGFDTRMDIDEKTPGFLKIMVKIFGYAAEPIAARLRKKGGTPAGVTSGFIVKGTEGPLKEGELERAASWAKSL